MNKVVLMGRLTRDPEVRYSNASENPIAIGNFSIAVDRRFKRQGDEATADFFNCTAFGKQGEFVEKYLKKGIKVTLSGHLQNDNYTDKSGNKVYSIRIIVEEIEFAESKGASGQTSGTPQQNSPSQPVNNGSVKDAAPAGGFMDIPDAINDELPFN